MSTVDMLVDLTLDTSVPFGIARREVSEDPLSYEESKEFDERIFKCEVCGNWRSAAEKNMIIDFSICDPCLARRKN